MKTRKGEQDGLKRVRVRTESECGRQAVVYWSI
jgi:hypothetical protein